MSRIFVSHNSADNQITEDIRVRLLEAGHKGVYVDYNPEQGIPAGRDWEMELYRELRTCQAMIILCSKASMQSLWCFAEVTHAKSVGKPVIPIKIEECEIHGILSKLQIIDWTRDIDEAWQRLKRGLLMAGIDPRKSFDWDGTRSPYPGLLSFEPEDAAIYFGHEKEIQEGLDILNRDRRSGGRHSLLVLGPSGSGKSSMVKAGVLPRLYQNEREWLILDTMRPRGYPIRELKWSLAEAFKRIDSEITPEINLDDADGLCGTLDQLLKSSGNRDAKVLLVIDQAEELVSAMEGGTESVQAFTRLIVESLGANHCPLHTIWTLRSDFLSEFQHHPQLRQLKSSDLHVGLMDSDDLIQVIEQPAGLAGVELERGLAQKIVSEVQGGDALPLLAFTLRELYERFHQDNLLETREYDQLGGLNGAVASKARDAYDASKLDGERKLELRRLFLSMVKLEQDGRFTRRPILRDSVPPDLNEVIERFVDSRLLVASADNGTGTLEVAHESLFRAWKKLSNWLDNDRDYLLWNRRLDYAIQEWVESDQSKHLLMRGKSLIQAEAHLREHPDEALNTNQEAFIEASREAQRLRERAKRIRRNIYLSGAALVFVLGLFASFWGYRASQRADQVYAAGITALADAQEDPLIASLLVSSLAKYTEPAHAVQVAIQVAQSTIPLDIMSEHEDNVNSIACSPDKHRIVSASSDFTARVWTLDREGNVVNLDHHASRLNGAIFSSNSRQIVTWSDDGNVYMQMADGEGDPRLVAVHEKGVESAQFNPNNDRHLMTASDDGTVNVWNVSGSGSSGNTGADSCLAMPGETDGQAAGAVCKVAALVEPGNAIRNASYSPDGRYLAAVSEKGLVRLWSTTGYREIDMPPFHSNEVTDAVFSPGEGDSKSTHMVTTAKDDRAVLWELDGLANGQDQINPIVLAGHSNWVNSAQFSPDGRRLVTVSDDRIAIYWNLENPENRVQLRGHTERVTSSEFSSDGKFVVTASTDDTVRVWDVVSLEQRLSEGDSQGTDVAESEDKPAEPLMVLEGHTDNVTATAFCGENNLFVTASNDDTVLLWDLMRLAEPRILAKQRGAALDVEFNWDGTLVAVAFAEAPAQLLDAHGTVRKNMGYARSVDFMPAGRAKNGDYVLTVSKENPESKYWSLVREWPVAEGRPATLAELQNRSFQSAVYDPGGDRFVTSNLRDYAQIWKVNGEKLDCCESHGKRTFYAEFNHGGDSLVTAMMGSNAMVGSIPGLEPDLTEPRSPVARGEHGLFVSMAVFSPDDTKIATASGDKTVRISSVDGLEEKVFTGHAGTVNSVAFSPDGTRLVSASQDGEARIWHTDGSGEAIILRADGSAIKTAKFSPDGRRIITASDDGAVRIWHFLWEDLLQYLEDSTRICLEVEQRMEYLNESRDTANKNYRECLDH